MKKLKNSVILDVVYSCCFIMVFLTILILTQTTDHEFAIFALSEPGSDELVGQLFMLFLIPGYIGLIFGVVGLIKAIKKLKNIDALAEKINSANDVTKKRFIKGYRLPLILHIIYLGLTIGIVANGVGAIDLIICIILIIAAYIIGKVAKSMRKKYVKEIKSEVNTAAE